MKKIQINYSRERLLNVAFPGKAYLPDLIPCHTHSLSPAELCLALVTQQMPLRFLPFFLPSDLGALCRISRCLFSLAGAA